MAVDGQGNVYIADTGNERVRRVDAAGTITTLAGIGGAGYSGDGGPAASAKLGYPYGVAVDGQGSVYIADGWHRVRKVDAAGTITTFAGTGSRTRVAWRWTGWTTSTSPQEVHRVSRVDATGTITTLAGTGKRGYGGDGGPALQAELGRVEWQSTGG